MFLPVYIWHGRGSWHLGYITPCLDMPCMAMCTVDRWMSTFQGGGLPVFQVQIRWIANAPLSVRSSSLASSDRWVSVDRSNPPGSPPSFVRPVVFSDPRFVPRLPRCSSGLHRAVDRPTQKDNQAEAEIDREAGLLLLLGVSFQTWVDRWPPLIPGTFVPVPSPSQGPDLEWASVAESDLLSPGTPAFSRVRNAWRVPPPFEPEWIRFQTGKGSGSIGRR